MNIKIPENYKSSLDLVQTQYFIKEIKEFFQNTLAKNLDLLRVSAPMFVKSNSGLNDNLSGVEKPVRFNILNDRDNTELEIVHSLSKWKRYALKKYNFKMYKGLYTDMNAIRAFEVFDNTHSIYVDQWDWEKIISEEDRNIEFLMMVVSSIFYTMKELETHIASKIDNYKKLLPEDISFITSQELENRYPGLSPEEREREYAKETKAFFVMQIGDILESGIRHGDRSPDYDDWALNGDLIVWNPILDDALELSSMGIRVTPESLAYQLQKSGNISRSNKDYHRALLNNELPLTIGGGIGQSRLCMFFLQKAHIGEVQVSVWPEEVVDICKENGIILL